MGKQRKSTEEDWRELGRQCQKIEEDLHTACNLAWYIMPIKDVKHLEKSCNQLLYFKSHAEIVMFDRLAISDKEVFYSEDRRGMRLQ